MMETQAEDLWQDAPFFGDVLTKEDGERFLQCMQCGLCSGTCPLGYAMEFPPRRILLQARAGREERLEASPSLWMCVECYTCSYRCPRKLELADELWPALRSRAMEDGFQPPAELQKTFENIYKYGNVLGQSPRKRMEWAAGLDVPLIDLSQNKQPVEVLWLVGDYPSYYPRNFSVSRGFARILSALGISFGVLGKEERSLGDCDRLFGEEGLFETLVEQNSATFRKHEFKEIVLLDTHSYRALDHFYPRLGAKFPAQHYTTFLAERVDQIKPLIKKSVDAKVTYHDNCCIGRRAEIYEEPRTLLEAIPGVELVEMARNREAALCCGGGGGGMWLDAHITENGGERLSDQRVRMAMDTGADVLAVSCPYELSRFEDSLKVVGGDQMKVRDIIELLAEAMGLAETEES